MRTKNKWELYPKPLPREIGAHTPHNLEPEHPPEFYQFNHRDGVHTSHEHKPTLWKQRNSRAKKGNRTSCDVVLRTRTKVIGREKRTGWEPPSTSKRVQRKVNNGNKWLEANAHRL